jgi:hypothetical protein
MNLWREKWDTAEIISLVGKITITTRMLRNFLTKGIKTGWSGKSGDLYLIRGKCIATINLKNGTVAGGPKVLILFYFLMFDVPKKLPMERCC